MNDDRTEVKNILEKFAHSGWNLIAAPAEKWLNGVECQTELLTAIREADRQCGSCGCEFDPFYKRILSLKELL